MANVSNRSDFLLRDRTDPLSQKRTRSTWGGRSEWDNQHGHVSERQNSERLTVERDRDFRDVAWERGPSIRDRGLGRDDSYFGGGNNSGASSSSGLNSRDRCSDSNDQRWSSSAGRGG